MYADFHQGFFALSNIQGVRGARMRLEIRERWTPDSLQGIYYRQITMTVSGMEDRDEHRVIWIHVTAKGVTGWMTVRATGL